MLILGKNAHISKNRTNFMVINPSLMASVIRSYMDQMYTDTANH